MSTRSFCIVTTTRAEYGILRSLIRETHADPECELRLLVSGSHLSREHGFTVREIEADGLPIWKRLPIQVSGSDEEAALKTVAAALVSLGPLLKRERPDLMILVGDRYEMIAFGLAALLYRVPLAHLHGGEITAGAVDEAIRHSLTKMASYHFVSTEQAVENVLQLGEARERIHLVGAPALDGLAGMELLGREELFAHLGCDPARPAALVTFHPETVAGPEAVSVQLAELLAALDASGLQAVFTGANADPGGAQITEGLQAAAHGDPERYHFFPSLGGAVYFSAMRHLDLMIGNSSSGIIEAPSFHLPVIDLGERQQGRVKAANTLETPWARAAISAAIARARSEEFRRLCEQTPNPYAPQGVGSIGRSIKEILKSVALSSDVVKKRFHRLGALRA